MTKLQKYFLVLCSIILILITFIPFDFVNTNYNASNGILDLSHYNFENDKNIELRGQWDLYYDELLSYDDLLNRKSNCFYNIPGKLVDQIQNAKQGYMTLHLKVLVPNDDIYGLYINSLFTSSDIWINGTHYGCCGKVGENINKEKAIYKNECLYFPSSNNIVDILIHTSVYRDVNPHLNPNVFGTKRSISKLAYINILMDGITIGILFIMIIINLGFYFVKHKQKRHIYFSIICLIILCRTLIFNSRLLAELFPTVHFEVISKMAALTFYLWVTFYVLFLNDIFKNKIAIKNLSIAFGAFFSLLCLLTPSTIYDYSAIAAQIIVILFASYIFVFMIKEVCLNNKDAYFNFFPYTALCATAINDFLVNNSFFSKAYLAIYGGLLFVLAESLFIIIDYFNSQKKLDNLNKDGLTGLYNNKYIKNLINEELRKFNSNKQIFSVLMIDVDNFKLVNDNYGHLFGDKVLVDISNILMSICNYHFYPGRFGGDEFILILPKINKDNSYKIAKQIMCKIHNLNSTYNIDMTISVSIGVYENNSSTVEECMNNVDTAMYHSKSNGKNQINTCVVPI